MRLIKLSHLDMELLFGIDAIDREELIKLLAAKITSDRAYPRRRCLVKMLQVLSPEHEALQ